MTVAVEDGRLLPERQCPESGGKRNRHILPYRKAKQTEREDIPMEKGYHKGQELTMSEPGLSLEELAGQPLELFAREGGKAAVNRSPGGRGDRLAQAPAL